MMTPERIDEFAVLIRELIGSSSMDEQLHGLYLNEFMLELAASQARVERLTAALENLHRNVGIFNEAEMAEAIRAALDGAPPVEASGERQGDASQPGEGV